MEWHYDIPGMHDADQVQYRKHELAYSQTGYIFVAFVCSSFGALNPSAILYLAALATLELRQNQAARSLQGLDPLDVSERAQYRASCYRSSSARIATAMAKETIMRLAGTPSLPVVAPFSRQYLARNICGVSDFCDLLEALLRHPPLPFPHLIIPVPLSLPLLLILFAPLHNPLHPLIVLPCPLLSCSPLLIYEDKIPPPLLTLRAGDHPPPPPLCTIGRTICICVYGCSLRCRRHNWLRSAGLRQVRRSLACQACKCRRPARPPSPSSTSLSSPPPCSQPTIASVHPPS
jgi:hypothetical protein